jgi:hypothetical protein
MEAGTLTPRVPKLLLGVPLALLAALIAIVISLAMLVGGGASCGGTEGVGGLSSKVPKRLVPIYKQAAA